MNEDNLLITEPKRILVVGNGFDIALDLPTKYTAFMRHLLMYRCMIKELPMPEIEADDKLYKQFAEKMENWRNGYINEETGRIDKVLFDDTLFRNSLILILIFKFNHKELSRSKSYLSNEGNQNSHDEVTIYPKSKNEKNFSEEAINGSEINWFNLEEILFEISKDEMYQKTINEIDIEIDNSCVSSMYLKNFKNKNYDELKNGLIFLKASLSIYLDCVKDIYLNNPSKQTLDIFKKICNILEYQENSSNKYSKIISLNYTNAAERLFKIPTNYPHGKINNDNPEKSKIVLGYYDNSTDNNFDTSFLEFQKFYQRILLGTGKYEELESKTQYIDFYGFSCDPADSELINTLLKNCKQIKRIRVFCYKDKGQYIINLIKCIGRERILDLTNQGTLEFILIHEQE